MAKISSEYNLSQTVMQMIEFYQQTISEKPAEVSAK